MVALVSSVLVVEATCSVDDIGDKGDGGGLQRWLVSALAARLLFLVLGVVSFAKRATMAGQILMNAPINKFEECLGNRQNAFDESIIDADSILQRKKPQKPHELANVVRVDGTETAAQPVVHNQLQHRRSTRRSFDDNILSLKSTQDLARA